MDSIIPIFGTTSTGFESILTNISGYGKRCGTAFLPAPISLQLGKVHVYAHTGSASAYLQPVIIYGASDEKLYTFSWSSNISPSYNIYLVCFYVSEIMNGGLYTVYVGNKKYDNVSKIQDDNAACDAFIYWVTIS